MRKLIIGFSLALLAACGEEDSGGIVIGALIDQTGSNAETSWVQAVRLAQEQMNTALEDAGSEVRFNLRFSDSGNNPSIAPTRAAELVVDEGARALITDTTQVTEAVARAMYQSPPLFNVLVQCSSCTSDALLNPASTVPGDPVLQAVRNNTNKNIARTVMSNGPTAYAALNQFRTATSPNGNPSADRNGDRTVKLAFYGANDASGIAATDALIRVAKEMFEDDYGIANEPGSAPRLRLERILHDATLAPSEIDFFADIARLTDTNTEDTLTGLSFGDATGADYIFVSTFARHAATFREALYSNRASNVVPVLYYDTFRQSGTLYQLGAIAVQGAIGISPIVVADTVDGGARFADDFRAATGIDPNPSDAAYYDNAVTIMLAALIGGAGSTAVTPAQIAAALPQTSVVGASSERVGPGVAALRRAIAAITARSPIDYDGASGPVNYDANNNVTAKLTMFEGRDGSFVDTTAPIDCVSSPTCGVVP